MSKIQAINLILLGLVLANLLRTAISPQIREWLTAALEISLVWALPAYVAFLIATILYAAIHG